jgi:hypothetical protein
MLGKGDYEVCYTKNDVPTVPHYAILMFDAVTIPGDERSRMYPGHGYSENVVKYASYRAYKNKDVWLKAIEELASSNNPRYVALYVEPAIVTTKTVVSVEQSKFIG